MSLTRQDINNVIDRYTKRYNEYGYSAKSLGWDKGKQEIRFDILTSQYNFNEKHVLDIGCGFGDLNKTLIRKATNYRYSGIDLVEALLNEAKKHYQGENITFEKANVLDFNSDIIYDYAISSGVFNHKLVCSNNYEFIEAVIEKALNLTKDGLAFDFLSDKVDYPLEYTFHSSPEKILSIAYKFSKNVILRNDYMPFEFSVFIFKDQSFNKEDTVFKRYFTLR
jgi:2-polyprenyl-3-methyl-5-hydroxy-6-metoxy-1,4-benzoquinol methylase